MMSPFSPSRSDDGIGEREKAQQGQLRFGLIAEKHPAKLRKPSSNVDPHGAPASGDEIAAGCS